MIVFLFIFKMQLYHFCQNLEPSNYHHKYCVTEEQNKIIYNLNTTLKGKLKLQKNNELFHDLRLKKLKSNFSWLYNKWGLLKLNLAY